MNTKKWWNAFFMVGSMILFFVVFWILLSWERALIISGSLFFHEYGHIFAMQCYRMKVKGMYFIPLIGGAAVPASRMPSQQSDIVISLAGPVFGLILATMTAIVYAMTGWTILGVAVVFMAIFNLFNLLPVFPLDGGRVLSCIAHSIDARIGAILMGGSVFLAGMMFFLTGHIIVLLVVFLAFQSYIDFVFDRPERKRAIAIVTHWLEERQALYPGYRADEKTITRMNDLREHPPLSWQWIVLAVEGWMMTVVIFCTLAFGMIQNPTVVEELIKFFQP